MALYADDCILPRCASTAVSPATPFPAPWRARRPTSATLAAWRPATQPPLCQMLTTGFGVIVRFGPGIVSSQRNCVTKKWDFGAGTAIAEG